MNSKPDDLRMPQSGVYAVMKVAGWLGQTESVFRETMRKLGYTPLPGDLVDMAEFLFLVERHENDQDNEE